MLGYIKKTKAANLFIKALQHIQLSSNNIPLAGNYTNYNYYKSSEQLNAYATVDDLYSIVRKIAKTCKRIPLYSYAVTDKKEFGKYRLLMRKSQHSGFSNKLLCDIKELQTKSLEIIGDNDPLQLLLDNPNDNQSKDEFYEAAYSFPLLTGNAMIYVPYLNAGANKGRPTSMSHLPPNYMNPVIGGQLTNYMRKIIAWDLNLYSLQMRIEIDGDSETVLHMKYFNPIFDYSGNELLGLSPLSAGCAPLSQAKNERDYVNRSLINAGAEGFISNEDADFNIESFGSIKDDILNELGATVDRAGSNLNARKLAVLLGKWKYNQIGISPVDLQLLEQRKMTKKKLCDLYGVSDTLFNNDDGSKYDNRSLAQKELITNVCLPEISSLCETLEKGLVSRYNDGIARAIGYDVTDIPELQEDTASIATRFSNLPGFKMNDLREAQGYGRDLGSDGEIFMLKQGYVPLSDAVTPVDMNTTQLDNENANDYSANH